MARLYELTERYTDALERLDECTTKEEADAVMAELEQLSDDIADKGEAYARIIRNKQSDVDAYAAEIKRLQARKLAAETAIEHMKESIQSAMTLAGANELTTSIGRWKIQKNPVSVRVSDLMQIPSDFLIIREPEVNRRAILEHYKDTGEILPGVDMVQTEGVRFR